MTRIYRRDSGQGLGNCRFQGLHAAGFGLAGIFFTQIFLSSLLSREELAQQAEAAGVRVVIPDNGEEVGLQG